MNEMQTFVYNDKNVRTVEKNDEPWFVLKDVCEVLEMDTSKIKQVADRLDGDEKGRYSVPTPGGVQESWIINESGLYNVILRSDKPEAKPFRKWVTGEVLPSIRKTGGYIAGQEQLSDADLMARALLVAKKQIDDRNRRIEEMRPKEIFADAVSASKTSILIGELAKLLRQNGVEMGQNRLFDWMRRNGYLIGRIGTDRNTPTQRAMEMGLFEVKETTVTHADGHITVNKTTKVTGKGQIYFINKFTVGGKKS